MIGLKVPKGWLVLAPGSITIDINSPFFSFGTVPGTITYPFGLPMEDNLAALNFPHVRAEQGDVVADEPCELYIDGQLRWVGALVYLDCDAPRGLFAYNFVADAADLQSRIEGITLGTLDLGRLPLSLVHNDPEYALPPLRNADFYGDKDPGFCGIVNYHRFGAYELVPVVGKRSTVVPFVRLVPLLRRVLGAVGYALSGDWLAEPEVQALVVYSDRSVEQADGTLPADFAVNRHVPDIGVAELLLALQKMFGLGYSFHPVRREMAIRSLRDVIGDQAYLNRTGGPAHSTAVLQRGFVLKMALESNDDLNKTLDTGWATLRVGAGQQEVSTEAGTLHVVRERDPADFGTREWLVPAVAAKGASPAFELGDDSRCGLRLLFDRGLQPDSEGYLYPLATWGAEDFAGNTVGTSTLRWDGADGLYATWHRAWLDFLDRATTREATMEFRVADLLSLDPARKEMVDRRKYLWEKVSLTLSTTGRNLEQAQFTYRYVRL
ncbi:hypothetical protein MUN81_10525 [Hymenobacter sp. 5317J-9]|uniref:hypothetical protein n=1 Tax=Hymenobacter sp. 5317J-9 TaxID=2932250 RepID=UPI001FD6434E|nr:hypothetical protein [Hymenobacter sp. 5317J-9]UOQ99914.1 hypothetical protein MUN81_10525 [Hymenobacter sp. 5317J-9]